jgi:hypothetical protein
MGLEAIAPASPARKLALKNGTNKINEFINE